MERTRSRYNSKNPGCDIGLARQTSVPDSEFYDALKLDIYFPAAGLPIIEHIEANFGPYYGLIEEMSRMTLVTRKKR